VGREWSIRRSTTIGYHIALRQAGIGPGCYETQMLSENVPDGAVRCSRWVVPGDCVRVFSRCSIRIHAIAAQKPLSNASIGVFARILSGDFTPYVALTASMSARIPIRLITRFML
jgi:hypothetical protein